MENLLELWKQICESNLFNFVVMLVVLAWLVKKFNLGDKIEQGRHKVEQAISESEKAKEESLSRLYDIQENVTKIDEQMSEVFKKAENNAKIIGNKLIEEGKIQSESIKENSKKTIDANIKTAKTEIVKETAQEAMTLAEQYIKSELEKDPTLHQKYILESIDAIEGLGVEI